MREESLPRLGAEVVGTALLMVLGTGPIVAAAGDGRLPSWELAGWWFLAVLVPVLLFVRVSGAHLNPAVTLALAASGRFAWRGAPAYVAAQLVGAFLGTAAVRLAFGSGAHLGTNLPTTSSVPTALLVEAAFTALLVTAVFVLADLGEGRARWRLLLPPGAVGVAVYLIAYWTGCSLNPARSLAPAVLSGTYQDLWIYLVAAPLGALAVAALWRPRTVDVEDRGPGRTTTDR